MATRFETVLHGPDAARLRAAGEAALAEIQRLEAALSFYRPTSWVGRLNARAAEAPVRVPPWLLDLLADAQRLWRATGGAFDLTVGPLMRCWGFTGSTGHPPDAAALEAARARTGFGLVELDAETSTVCYARPGVELDLGGIGKGYAIDEAARILGSADVAAALLHGGTSTAVALGTPPDAEAWSVALPAPDDDAEPAVVAVRDEALAVSAGWGKAFEAVGASLGHVLDPRQGRPVSGAAWAAVVAPSATAADAWSTALLVLEAAGDLSDVALPPEVRVVGGAACAVV